MADLRSIRAVIADMDGVLWRDHDPIAGAADFFQYLHRQATPYMFATNNASRTVAYYQDKMANLGIPARPDQIITSATATADFLAGQYPRGTTAYVVGEVGLKSALQAQGFTLLTEVKNTPRLVVVGLDRQFSYNKLHQAMRHIHNGAVFIATNTDVTFPASDGLAPGAGSLVAAIAAGVSVVPQVIGKPALPMFQLATQRLGIAPEETLMIGDRLETDIWGGKNARMKTALVLSGISQESDIIDNNLQPDFVFQNLAELLLAYQQMV